MKIEQDIKLDFSDVLIRPKRSILESRSQINLEREFKFPHSTQIWKGIPIIASNMDTVGTIEIDFMSEKTLVDFPMFDFFPRGLLLTLEDRSMRVEGKQIQ